MNDSNGYAVFFFPQALEALGEAIKPYLQNGDVGPHVLCNEVDTGGAFVELTMRGKTDAGKDVALQLMVPNGMVRMVVSTHSDASFGFNPHAFDTPVGALPPAAPAAPAEAPAIATPEPAAATKNRQTPSS